MGKKMLVEQRNDKLAAMEKLLGAVKEQTRAFTEEEDTEYTKLKGEIRILDSTLAALDEEQKRGFKEGGEPADQETRALDERFISFVRGEKRALDVANNGGIIPVHIANKIVETVKELCPIYAKATVYNVGGDLIFPVYDEAADAVTASYVGDTEELSEGSGKFTTVKLENHIIGCLSKVSKSLLNRTDFDLLGFTVRKIAQAIAEFLEKELLIGTAGKMTGVFSSTKGITAAAQSVITADELIDLQMTVPEVYQTNACWIMHKETLKAIRKLKDSDGDYLMNRDITSGFGWTLLGKPVYVSQSCPTIEAGGKPVIYGDMSGLYVKLAQNVEIQVLVEKYSTQHAIGVVGYIECDSKLVEPQKLAVLTMKA